MDDADRSWMKDLQEQLWEKIPPQYNGGRLSGYGYMREKRALTTDEWKRLKAVMDSDELIFQLGSVHGFTLQMSIFEGELYPGTGPRFLVTIDQKQVPEEEGTTGATLGGSGESWKKAWELFTKYSHSDRNAEKLKLHDMSPPREESYYAY